jgi:hypothetical protein
VADLIASKQASMFALVTVCGCLSGIVVWAAGQGQDSLSSRRGAEAGAVETESHEKLLREGSDIVDEVGRFHDTGDRVLFQPHNRQGAFQMLENLALERMAIAMEEAGSERLWSVSGTVTEYRGANFLLLTKAILKAKNAQASPARAR